MISIKAHEQSINSVGWHNNILASGSSDMSVILWSANLKRLLVLKDNEDWVRSVHWSYDGTLATGSEDKTVNVYQFNDDLIVEDKKVLKFDVSTYSYHFHRDPVGKYHGHFSVTN